jgi:tRNA pseudouridine38-40 synthase
VQFGHKSVAFTDHGVLQCYPEVQDAVAGIRDKAPDFKPIYGVEAYYIDDSAKIVYRLNSLLPQDISIDSIFEVEDTLHARFSAKSRTYKYYVSTKKSPFDEEFAARLTFPLDEYLMNQAAKVLFEYEDFTSFSKVHTDVKTNNCKIYQAQWERVENHLIFTIKADRFLRNMVRAIVGTLIEVGKGAITIEEFRKIIESKNRCAAGMSVPAKGLFFVEAEY